MTSKYTAPASLGALLQERAVIHGHLPFVRYLHEDLVQTLSFADAHQEALRHMQYLDGMVRVGDRVLLGVTNPCEFVAVFFGILYAGGIPVPIASLRRKASLQPLEAVVGASGAKVVVTDNCVVDELHSRSDAASLLSTAIFLSPQTFLAQRGSTGGQPVRSREDDVAFIQFTSGSTSSPKGAVVTHRNLLENQRLIQAEFRHSEKTIFAGWLPLYHDMGLIGNLLQPLYLGIPTHLLSPGSFVERPARLLKAISRYKATTCGMPNFGYAHCLQRVRDTELEGVDLSQWLVAFNGAEPIRSRTLHEFAERFAPWGFRRDAIYPCYGLAEATLFVTGWRPGLPWVERLLPAACGEAETRSVVCTGYLNDVQQVRIVDPTSAHECPASSVGEIWISGPCVVRRYWNAEVETQRSFDARLDTGEGPFLRTGDLGFVEEGRLYVTGRLKDLIIVRGKNHYPQDIEASVVASSDDFHPLGTVCFMADELNDERVVVVQEVRRTAIRHGDEKAWLTLVRDKVAKEHQLTVADVRFVLPNAIPRTTSGKLQRQKCRALYHAGKLPSIQRGVPTARLEIATSFEQENECLS